MHAQMSTSKAAHFTRAKRATGSSALLLSCRRSEMCLHTHFVSLFNKHQSLDVVV